MFFIKASAEGTALVTDVLATKTFSNDNDIGIQGAISVNGALNYSLPINGTYNIPSGYTTGGSITQSIPVKTAQTYNPSTSTQTIALGQYLSGNQVILGDSNLISSNIISGKSIFGVSGNYNPLKLIAGTSITLYDAIVNYECNSISSYVLAKSVTNGNIGGTVTVSFSLADGSTGNGGAYGRIYVNGVAVGTERYIAPGTSTTWFTEDITINTGDSIQIYAHKGSNPAAGDIYVVELKISCGNSYGTFS